MASSVGRMVRETRTWPTLNSPSVPRSDTMRTAGIWGDEPYVVFLQGAEETLRPGHSCKAPLRCARFLYHGASVPAWGGNTMSGGRMPGLKIRFCAALALIAMLGLGAAA